MIEWNNGGSSKDDFTAREGGYCLRVEKMGRYWWWQVYYPDGTTANPGCDLDAPSERVAKRICEIIYELHYELHNAPSERVAKRICEIIYELHRKG